MKFILDKERALLLVILLIFLAGCLKKEPEPDIYRLKDVIVTGMNNEHIGAYAIVRGEEVEGVVPYDGTDLMDYKVTLIFPQEIGDVHVSPASYGIFNFTDPVNFEATFVTGKVKNYRIKLTKDTLDLPVISSFTIPWINPEMTAINTLDKEIYARMAENTPLTAIKPLIKFNKPTVVQRFPVSGPVDFSKGSVTYMLENGNQTAEYKVFIRDYGYGKLAHVSRFTHYRDARLTNLTGIERSAALDNTGNYIYVTNGSLIQRYLAASANTQTPANVNLQIGTDTIDATSHIENVCVIINNVLDSKFYACNEIENGGIFRIYNWTSYTAAPKLVAEIDLTSKGATIDCFTWRYVNNRVYVYLVDIAPLNKPIPENPKVYILRDLNPTNLITSYEEKIIDGVINTGFQPGPFTQFTNIDGSEEFILNNGLSSPLVIGSAFGVTKTFPETPGLPKSISGIKTFQFKRGKYISYVEYSETATTEPSAYLNVINATELGFSTTINNIIAEGSSEETLKQLRQVRIPLGSAGNATMYANTSFNIVGEKMRILASIAENGIYMFEWE